MINKFMDHKAGVSEHTVKTYLSTLTRFKKYCEERGVRMQDASRSIIASYINQWKTGSSSTRFTYLEVLSSYFSFLVYERVRERNPVVGMKKQFKGNARRKKQPIVVRNNLHRMLKACSGVREKTIIISLWYSGTRAVEMLNCKIDDVDLVHGAMFVSKSKSLAGNRDIPINARWMPFLKLYSEYRMDLDVDHDFFFVNTRDKPLKYRAALVFLHKIQKKAGLKKHGMHAFRRGFGTELFRQTKNIMVTKEILGHESVATTQGYIQLTDDEIDSVRELDI